MSADHTGGHAGTSCLFDGVPLSPSPLCFLPKSLGKQNREAAHDYSTPEKCNREV